MPTWKLAATVFHGGTEQIKALNGRKVRTRAPLAGAIVFDPDPDSRRQENMDIASAAVGFVARPHPQHLGLLVAFPTNSAMPLTDMDKLAKSGKFKVAVINEATFKQQFEVEMP